MAGINEKSLEAEEKGECRVFCLINNGITGKWRITQADAVFVNNRLTNATPEDVVRCIDAQFRLHYKDKYKSPLV